MDNPLNLATATADDIAALLIEQAKQGQVSSMPTLLAKISDEQREAVAPVLPSIIITHYYLKSLGLKLSAIKAWRSTANHERLERTAYNLSMFVDVVEAAADEIRLLA